MITACAQPTPRPVFQPTAYREARSRVTMYPTFAYPGSQVIIVARPPRGSQAEVCLRVIDVDAAPWHETCWEGGDSRRIPFHPSRTGTHIAYLAYRTGDGWATTAHDRAAICVIGEGSDCP